jgi:DNA polymerase
MQKSDEMNSAKVSEEINLEGINTLEELKHKMSTFQGCQLYKSATNMVFSDGNPKSKIMLIGEAPGHDEDLQAKPFVGRSGKLLDKMLEAIDLNREKVYIANIIPWRPPANRRPTEDEINSCLPFILKHIEIIKPSALMLLGSTATFAILRNKEGISKIRGKWVDLKINQMTIPTMPTFHPAFLLRQPGQKKHVWTDLQSLRDKIKQK